MNGGSAEIERLADGLWLRLRDVILAERRLEGFAFGPEPAEAPGARPPGRLAALLADEAALVRLARDVTLRALGAAADPVSYGILTGLGNEPASLGEVARAAGLPALAVSERVNALAQLGLAARVLEHDGVAATAAGRGLVALVEAIGGAVAARCRAGARSLA